MNEFKDLLNFIKIHNIDKLLYWMYSFLYRYMLKGYGVIHYFENSQCLAHNN